jgi:hypothetical protein
MKWIFWGFCRNWFLTDPFHYLSSRSDFGFDFTEIFIMESLFEFYKIYHHFKRLNHPFKISIWQKRRQGCNVLSSLTVSVGNLVDSPTRWIGELFFDYEYLRKFEAKIGTARNVVPNLFMQKPLENPPHCHVPLSFCMPVKQVRGGGAPACPGRCPRAAAPLWADPCAARECRGRTPPSSSCTQSEGTPSY